MGRLEEEHLVNNPLERIRALEIQLKELQRNALTSVEAVGGVTDHGSLTGLGDDDHTQYVLADGSRSFTGTVGGVTPSAASDLATKGYVDTAPWTDHGNLLVRETTITRSMCTSVVLGRSRRSTRSRLVVHNRRLCLGRTHKTKQLLDWMLIV